MKHFNQTKMYNKIVEKKDAFKNSRLYEVGKRICKGMATGVTAYVILNSAIATNAKAQDGTTIVNKVNKSDTTMNYGLGNESVWKIDIDPVTGDTTYTVRGMAEQDSIFRTMNMPNADTNWVVTRQDSISMGLKPVDNDNPKSTPDNASQKNNEAPDPRNDAGNGPEVTAKSFGAGAVLPKAQLLNLNAYGYKPPVGKAKKERDTADRMGGEFELTPMLSMVPESGTLTMPVRNYYSVKLGGDVGIPVGEDPSAYFIMGMKFEYIAQSAPGRGNEINPGSDTGSVGNLSISTISMGYRTSEVTVKGKYLLGSPSSIDANTHHGFGVQVSTQGKWLYTNLNFTYEFIPKALDKKDIEAEIGIKYTRKENIGWGFKNIRLYATASQRDYSTSFATKDMDVSGNKPCLNLGMALENYGALLDMNFSGGFGGIYFLGDIGVTYDGVRLNVRYNKLESRTGTVEMVSVGAQVPMFE